MSCWAYRSATFLGKQYAGWMWSSTSHPVPWTSSSALNVLFELILSLLLTSSLLTRALMAAQVMLLSWFPLLVKFMMTVSYSAMISLHTFLNYSAVKVPWFPIDCSITCVEQRMNMTNLVSKSWTSCTLKGASFITPQMYKLPEGDLCPTRPTSKSARDAASSLIITLSWSSSKNITWISQNLSLMPIWVLVSSPSASMAIARYNYIHFFLRGKLQWFLWLYPNLKHSLKNSPSHLIPMLLFKGTPCSSSLATCIHYTVFWEWVLESWNSKRKL